MSYTLQWRDLHFLFSFLCVFQISTILLILALGFKVKHTSWTNRHTYIQLKTIIAERGDLALSSPGVGWLVGLSVKLSSSELVKATNKFYTVLERGQIAHKDPTIKSLYCSSQESGTSYMFPKDTY